MAKEENPEVDRLLRQLQKEIDEKCNVESVMAGEVPAPRVYGMYMLPDVLRAENRDAYSPSSVTIGPLFIWERHARERERHARDIERLSRYTRDSEEIERLSEMEAVKITYMSQLLERSGTFAATRRECVEAVLNLWPRVLECYSEVSSGYRPTIWMMIDGGFIIELVYRKCVEMPDHPILQSDLKYHQVKRDLLLLENQIPFFTLEELFRLTVERIPPPESSSSSGSGGGGGGGDRLSLRRCVLLFFGDIMGLKTSISEIENQLENNHPFHILHFLHICFHSPFQEAPKFYKHTEKPRFKHSATKLQSVGVKFGPRSSRASLFDLKFTSDRRCFCLWRRGHFKIPPFSINEHTESFLRNLIAFEHCCPGIDRYFTSHAVAMSILIDSGEDVKLLGEAGVIRNNLDSGEAVSELFKNITRQESIVRNQLLLYKDLWVQVTAFCTPWRLALANVTTQIAVFSIIILNLITLLSSIYTVLSYYSSN